MAIKGRIIERKGESPWIPSGGEDRIDFPVYQYRFDVVSLPPAHITDRYVRELLTVKYNLVDHPPKLRELVY